MFRLGHLSEHEGRHGAEADPPSHTLFLALPGKPPQKLFQWRQDETLRHEGGTGNERSRLLLGHICGRDLLMGGSVYNKPSWGSGPSLSSMSATRPC